MKLNPGFRPGLGMNLFSLTPPDLACYAYAMVNRQDVPYLPGSPEFGRHLLLVEIIFVGTKLAIEPQPSQNHYRWYRSLFRALSAYQACKLNQCHDSARLKRRC